MRIRSFHGHDIFPYEKRPSAGITRRKAASIIGAPFRHYMGTGHSALNTSTRKEIIMNLGKWIRPVIVVMLFGTFLTGQSKSAMAEEGRSESAISP